MKQVGMIKLGKTNFRDNWKHILAKILPHKELWQKAKTQRKILLVGQERLYVLELKYIKGSWRLIATKYHEAQAGEAMFFQEMIYRYGLAWKSARAKENEARQEDDIGIDIGFLPELVECRTLDLPILTPKELDKALTWEVGELPKDYEWKYRSTRQEAGLKLSMIIYDKKQVNFWQKLVVDEGLVIENIFGIDYAAIAHLENLAKIEKLEEIEPKTEETEIVRLDAKMARKEKTKKSETILGQELNTRLKPAVKYSEEMVLHIEAEGYPEDILSLIQPWAQGRYISLIPEGDKNSLWKWRKIFEAASIVMVAFTAFGGAYTFAALHNQEARLVQSTQQAQLIAKDLQEARGWEEAYKQVKAKEMLIKELYNKNSNFYPMVVKLGTNTVEGVVLKHMEVSPRGVVLQGTATDYSSLSQYKQALTQDNLGKDLELAGSKVDAKEGVVEFTITGKPVKANE